MTIQQVICQVDQSSGSIFTREDVINILKSIELEEQDTLEVPKKGKKGKKPEEVFTLTLSQGRELAILLSNQIESNIQDLDDDDIIDRHNAEFELSGNEISLESVAIDKLTICSVATDDIEDSIEEFLLRTKRR